MMEYNTARNQLVIRSYGRNIQKMIEDVVKIEDAHKRNEAAKAIIRIMAQVNPENTTQNATQNAQRESEDYWHKLWNHLVIISDYKLNIDAPFPKPVPHTEKLQQVLHSYDNRTIRYRTYGRNMENIIRTVSQYPEAQRQKLVLTLANHLKKLFLYYNRDSVDDAFIAIQINEMSGGKLKLPEGYTLESTKDILKNYSPINAASLSKNNGSKKPKKKKKIRKPQR